MLLYSGGSTGEPREVKLTSADLARLTRRARDEEMIRRGTCRSGRSERSVIVGWLPMHHVRGLIGTVLQPLWTGALGVLVSPAAFLQRPARPADGPRSTVVPVQRRERAARVRANRVAAIEGWIVSEVARVLGPALGIEGRGAELPGGVSTEGFARAVVEIVEAETEVSSPGGSDRPELPDPDDAGLLSHGERALWYLHGLAPRSSAYTIAVAARLAEEPSPGILRRAFGALVARHDALRTTFVLRDGEPRRRVVPADVTADRDAPDFVEVVAADWSGEELDRRVADEAHRPFDLERGPLVRMRLFRGAPGGTVVMLALHHAIGDFWSLAVVARDLGALLSGEPPAPLSGGGAALAARVERRLLATEGDRLWAWWRDRLAGIPRSSTCRPTALVLPRRAGGAVPCASTWGPRAGRRWRRSPGAPASRPSSPCSPSSRS